MKSWLSKALPYDSPLRAPAKRWFTDLRTLARSAMPWLPREDQPPAMVAVETTNICNANCIFCAYQYQDAFRKGKGAMEADVFGRVLAGCQALGVQRLSFTPLVGEPLADKHIIERLTAAVSAGFRVSFHTNGILLNRVDPGALLDTGLQEFLISTAPLDEEAHKRLYRTRHYADLLNGLERFLKVRNERNAPLRVRLHFRSDMAFREATRLPDYTSRIVPLLRPEEREAVEALIIGYDSWGGQIKPEDLVGAMHMARPPRLKHRPCALTFSPQVLWDGKVRACPCYFGPVDTRDAKDPLYVGDLNEESLVEIWRGDRLRQVRRNFANGTLPDLCVRCTMYESV